MPRAQSQATLFNLIAEDPLIKRRDTMRKSSSNLSTEGMIPIPIQIFLWRQTDPFIKKRFGDLTSTSALTFKRILVQHISHGLSPSLTDAINSIPRWLFMQVAFPHVMRACSAMIQHTIRLYEATITRNIRSSHVASISSSVSTHMPIPISLHLPGSPYFLFSTPISSSISTERPSNLSSIFPRSSTTTNPMLTSTEIHLFHTLHHLMLHMNDKENSSNSHQRQHPQQQQQPFLSLNMIELFIYLFMPYIESYFHKNEKEFLSNGDLTQGMILIWQPLFEHRQPNIRPFNAFVKPIRSSDVLTNHSSTLNDSHRSASNPSPGIPRSLSEKQSLSYLNDLSSQTLMNTPIDRHGAKTLKEDPPLASDFFVDADSIPDLRPNDSPIQDRQVQAPIADINSICSVSDLHRLQVTHPCQTPAAELSLNRYGLSLSVSAPSISQMGQRSTSMYETSSNKSILSGTTLKARSSNLILLATYFDVGIVRILFIPSWVTEGYLWSLEYLHQRLVDISDRILSTAITTGVLPHHLLRIKSLSMPNIDPIDESNFHELFKCQVLNEEPTNDIIEQRYATLKQDHRSPMHSFKQTIRSLTLPARHFTRRSVRLGRTEERYTSFYRRIRRIHYIDDENIEHLDLIQMNLSEREIELTSSARTRYLLNHSRRLSSRSSQYNAADRSKVLRHPNKSPTRMSKSTTNLCEMKLLSLSDSEIDYKCLEAMEEAHGSSNYINRNGTMNFGVILAALHAVICKDDDLKVCESIMSSLDVLFGLAVISSTDDDREKKLWFDLEHRERTRVDRRAWQPMDVWYQQINAKDNEKYQLALDILLRILKRLGCAACRTQNRSFTVDQLRAKVRLALNRMHQINAHRFEQCFLNLIDHQDLNHIMDIFHSLCSFCSVANLGLGHYAPYMTFKSETDLKTTHSNSISGTYQYVGSRNINDVILKIVVKPLVSRLNTIEKELVHPKNTTLHSDIRIFFSYMKQVHQGTFRSLIFSALIDPQKKYKADQKQQQQQQQQISSVIKERSPRRHPRQSRISMTIDTDRTTTSHRLSIEDYSGHVSPLHREIERIHSQNRSLYEEDSSCVTIQQEANLYVDLHLVRQGLLRFHFLLQSCPPASIPDPPFLNNLLFLDAPIIAKAAYLLECANFVRRCSLGQWPEWMRSSLNSSRSHPTLSARRNSDNISKLNRSYQLAAVRMFYLWGEALASQLEMILENEAKEDTTKKLWNGDEIYQDYYQEAIVNSSGHDCPYSLQLIVCLLLFEITSFIRETLQTSPRIPSLSTSSANPRPVKPTVAPPLLEVSSMTLPEPRPPNRLRMDSIISLISHRSAISSLSEHFTPSSRVSPNTTINMNSTGHERHISFSIHRENDSTASNHTTVLINENEEEHCISLEPRGSATATMTKPTGSNVKSKLIRRNSAKMRKPSFRMKEGGKNPHRPSFRTRRRSHVFNLSADATTAAGPGIHSANETTDESMISPEELQDQNNFETMVNTRVFPWIEVVIRIFNRLNLNCKHQEKCLANCYDKQTNSCQNLIHALSNMYQSANIRVPIQRQNTTTSRRTNRFSMPLFDDSAMDEAENHPHFQTMITYLKRQVPSLISVPLMILCKSSVLLEEEHYSQVLQLTWKVLLDRNEELSSSAATMIILTAARAGHLIDRLFHQEMQHPSARIRYEAILKFQTLWRFRSQFRVRLEDGALATVKILPPSIEFVLPSPLLGIANLQTVDPPWVSPVKTRVQQVALNQEEVKAVITASKSRQKHQQELIHSALLTEETSKRVAREHFALSTVSILSSAAHALLAHQSKDEEDEVYLDDDRLIETNLHLRQVQGTIPSSFSAGVFHLIDMLEDVGMIENGATVSQVAEKTLWTCLVDEPTLIVRFFFEKLSQKERRKKSLQNLRRLMISFVDMPSQCAHTIFNYVLGLVVSMIRSPLEGAQDLILAGLTLLWQIIPYLHGLVLKDLKQILRTEQAEMMILVTGNLPSAKRVIIHGPDASQIPTQALIAEDTLFSHVFQEAVEFFGIPESKRDQSYLIDIKTQQIHIPDTYVRDFYYFHRNIYPQLSLITMNPKQAHLQLEQRAIFLKTTELSKVLFARHLLENTPYNQIYSSVTFFHNELMKSPLFPRKPLESDFNVTSHFFDKELFNLDMLHKYNWIKLISCLFFNMDGKTTTMWDITLFINVINGSFVLHCEDLAMLRFCLATYINIAQHFHHIFATNGYSLIMPNILRVYSNIQSNPMVKKAIEYACRQFFILHRLPFILQMFGSISKLLDADEQSDVADTNKIQPISLFRLILSLEQRGPEDLKDEYSMLELIRNESSSICPFPISRTGMLVISTVRPGAVIAMKKIRSLDFCYADDECVFTFLQCLDVCVSVVAYAPDSDRSLQMLSIIDLLLPKYLEQIQNQTNKRDIRVQGREEVKIIEKLTISIRTIISVLEHLTRTFVEPKHDSMTNPIHRHGRSSSRTASVMVDEDSMSRFVDDRAKSRAQDADERKQASEFRAPRDTLLSIVSNFVDSTSKRLKELQKSLNDPALARLELLDHKSYHCLAEIAHTLLKLSSFDPVTISARGLQNYFQKLLPWTDWSQEQLRSALNLLLRRIDRMLVKICKRPIVKRCFNWEATAGIVRGIYSTVDRHPYIAHFPSLKALVSGCITLILNENLLDTDQNIPRLDSPTFPKEFPQAVIKLVGRYLLAIKNQPNLEAITNMHNSLSNYSLMINHLLHFLLPLMFWACTGRNDAPKFHPNDISYIVTILISSIKPASKLASTMGTQTAPPGAAGGTTARQYLIVNDNAVPGNSFTHKLMKQMKDLVQAASLLGLKLLIIGFSKQLKREWTRIVQAIKLMCHRQSNMPSNLLGFIDFLVSYRTPIYLLLRPSLLHYLNTTISENERDYELINSIHQKLLFDKITPSKSTGAILSDLRQELNQLRSRTSDDSKGSLLTDYRPVGTDRVRFDPRVHEQSQSRDHDEWTTRTNSPTDKRSTPSRTTPLPNLRQKRSSDSSLNAMRKRKATKVRLKESLEILEQYQERCKAKSNVIVDEKVGKWTRDSTLRSISSIADPMPIVLTSDTPPLQSPLNSIVSDDVFPTFHGSKESHLTRIDSRSHRSSKGIFDRQSTVPSDMSSSRITTVQIHWTPLSKTQSQSHCSSAPSVAEATKKSIGESVERSRVKSGAAKPNLNLNLLEKRIRSNRDLRDLPISPSPPPIPEASSASSIPLTILRSKQTAELRARRAILRRSNLTSSMTNMTEDSSL